MGEGQTRDVAARLHSASIRLLRALRREDDGSGLSAPRLSALSYIVVEGPVSLAELAEAEQVRPPTMSRIVDALVDRGLVTRVVEPRDRRSVRIMRHRGGQPAADRRRRAPRPRADRPPPQARRFGAPRSGPGVEILERVAR